MLLFSYTPKKQLRKRNCYIRTSSSSKKTLSFVSQHQHHSNMVAGTEEGNTAQHVGEVARESHSTLNSHFK